jgi:enoyl-CoA hydratase
VTEFKYLRTTVEDRVAIVTLDHPPVNAINQPMYAELITLFGDVERELPGASTVVLTGSGKNFCGGNDLSEFGSTTPENIEDRIRAVREAFLAIRVSPYPVIAAVRGAAVGAGVAIVGSCDMIVASETARFALPEIGVGVMGGAKHFMRFAPHAIVRRLHYTADFISARELLPYGAIDSVVADDDLLPHAVALAGRIVRHSPAAIRTAKRSLNEIEYTDVTNGYRFEQRMTAELTTHPDSKEALAAYVEGRDPHYAG